MQLYLCEKPSQAKDIARVLGISKRGQGFISGGNIIVTWAIGHLLEQASPDAYGEQFGKPWRADGKRLATTACDSGSGIASLELHLI